MSVELKVFGGAYFPKDKALKKHPDLKPLATAVNSATKTIAEAVIFGKLASEHPEHIDDYFKVKIWEHREGLPCPELDVFSSNFFDTVAIWNVNAGEPTAAPQSETDEKADREDNQAQEEVKTFARLDQTSRAACLALFGPVPGITEAQYGQIVDLVNDDAGSFTRELTEALTKEPRALSLAPERQEQLLAWVRENTKESSQWPDIKKQIAKWLDTPVDKRPQATTITEESHTDSGATLRGGNKTDRSPDLVHNLSTLRIEVAVAILSMYDEIDIYWIPNRFMMAAKGMAEAAQDPQFTAWWAQLRGTPGILDYSRAAIIALIKSAPEDLWLNPIKLREYINRELVESNHAKPDQKTIDIACKAKPRVIPEEKTDDKTQPSIQSETLPPAVCPGKAAQFNKELKEAFTQNAKPAPQANEQPRVENLGDGIFSVDTLINNTSNEVEKEEVPPALSARETEIAQAINDLISGRTNIMGKEEAEGVVKCTGHSVSDLIPSLMTDIATTEYCLSPDFSDEEIHDVATTLLDSWSDDISVRQKIALDAIVEYRLPELPKPVVLDTPVVSAKPQQTPEQQPEANSQQTSLSYQQQLTIAALQGLCANPAYCNQYDDLPIMATELARSVESIIQQEGSRATD
ncbi:exodeoxyribonuclease VIII [Enterobacter hormaechei]